MNRGFKRFIAIALACLMAMGCLAGIAETAAAGRNFSGTKSVQRFGEDDSAALLAKSKKKKTTATPRVTASPTPTAAPTETPAAGKATPTPEPEGPITDPQSIADYLFSHDMQLPKNFITKEEAHELGWQYGYRYVSDAAPGKSIGGDRFSNYERQLPTGKGISYKEADCNYVSGPRGGERIVFSTDGRVWYTGDHYETFEELFPSGE